MNNSCRILEKRSAKHQLKFSSFGCTPQAIHSKVFQNKPKSKTQRKGGPGGVGWWWCSLVLLGAPWCSLVLPGAPWCSLELSGALWCYLVLSGALSLCGWPLSLVLNILLTNRGQPPHKWSSMSTSTGNGFGVHLPYMVVLVVLCFFCS